MINREVNKFFSKSPPITDWARGNRTTLVVLNVVAARRNYLTMIFK